MKTPAFLAMILACVAGNLRGQLVPEISKKLRSPELMERFEAYQSVVSERPLSAEAKTALVELLLREDLVTEDINWQGLGTDDKYGERYEFTRRAWARWSSLSPRKSRFERTCGLHWCIFPYNSGYNFVAWLAKYGDKVTGLLLAEANDEFYLETSALDDRSSVVGSNAVDALAIIGAREDVAVLERVALTDPEVVTNGGPSGTETRFFVREEARSAAEKL